MPELPSSVSDVLSRFDFSAALDILLITLTIYWLLLLIRGTTAMTVLRGAVVLLLGAFLLSRILDLVVVNWILRNSVAGIVIAMTVVFQPEIRRALEQLGRTGMRTLRREDYRTALDEIVHTAFRLARQRHGALLVLERAPGLADVIDTGVRLNAALTDELLVSIFTPNTPLHDGAVVVMRDRVLAAGCTLPLSESPLPEDYGMRHRAALGITERTDAVVVIVSEERGEVSLASNGRMLTTLDEARLIRELHRLFGVDEPASGTAAGSTERRPS